ncbi:MAG: GNAT family N-acetyltransferase, partial [Actinomycetota bacterium]|nr:GNAT family N-acetyltransferase [Actinomycetota bacterium]
MTAIRPIERADLERAAAVFDLMLGSGHGRPERGLVEFFAGALFEDPWADPEMPSLVAEDDHGKIVGVMTISSRRMRLGQRPVRIAVCGNLAVTPEGQRRAIGVRLLQRALEGPQDAAISDTASEVVRRMWIRLGGSTVPLSAIHWVRVFAPWRTGFEVGGVRLRRTRARRTLERVAGGLDRA